MRWLELLAHFSLTFTEPDDSRDASIREGLLGRLRAAGWSPAVAHGDGGEAAWQPVAHRGDERHEAFLEARIDAYQEVLEEMGPRSMFQMNMVLASNDGLPPTEADVDAGLLTAFVRRDAAAFDTLVARYAGRLHGQARRWLRAADAIDAVQDTFMMLFERATGLLERGDVAVGGFLFSALRFKIVRALDTLGHVWLLASRLLPSPDDGLTTLLRREGDSKLVHYLDRACNPLEQEVMALDLLGRSDPEIAAELGMRRAHVRVIRRRARAKLRRAMHR